MERILNVIKTKGDRRSIVDCVLNLNATAVRLNSGIIVTSTQYDDSIRLIKISTSTRSVKIYLDREDVTSLRSKLYAIYNLANDPIQVYYEHGEWHVDGLEDPFNHQAEEEDEDELY